MSNETTELCPTCKNSIWCGTWAEWKCVAKKQRIYAYKTMTTCGSYKKRPKDFKESLCQCEDCLRSADTFNECWDV